MATAHAEMGNKLINVATTEAHPPLGNAMRKIGRTWHSLADLDHAQAISECVIIGDSFGYQGMNARSAKETLQMRTGVLEEYQTAVKTTISKRRHIERLKASSNIKPDRVDEALEDMEEVCIKPYSFSVLSNESCKANKYEQVLAKRAEGISQNLHQALQTHNRYANDDITTALIEHARSSIMYERQLLRELEALRSDVASAANKVVPAVNVPKPLNIPPLEEFSKPRISEPPSAPISNGYQPPPQIHAPQASEFAPSLGTSRGFTPYRPGSQASHSQGPAPSREPPSASHSFASQLPTTPTLPPSSPGAGPSSSNLKPFSSGSSATGPPLGGRFIDGTQSMFVQPTSSPLASPVPSASGSKFPVSNPQLDPLRSDAYQRPSSSPLHTSVSSGPLGFSDPLGQIKPNQLSSSMRVQPTRPRLDPREAASKLANMF